MRYRLGGRAYFSAALLVFVVVMLGASLGLGPTARLVPLRVALPTVALLAIQTFREASADPSSERRDKTPRRQVAGDELGALIWVLALPALVFSVGLPAAAPVYVFALLRLRAGSGAVAATIAAISTWALAYVVFVRLLGTSAASGQLWHWWGP